MSGVSTVDEAVAARDERRVVAEQEPRERGDLGIRPEAPGRVLLLEGGQRLTREARTDERGVDEAGADRVRANALRRVLEGCDLGQPDEGVLAVDAVTLAADAMHMNTTVARR